MEFRVVDGNIVLKKAPKKLNPAIWKRPLTRDVLLDILVPNEQLYKASADTLSLHLVDPSGATRGG